MIISVLYFIFNQLFNDIECRTSRTKLEVLILSVWIRFKNYEYLVCEICFISQQILIDCAIGKQIYLRINYLYAGTRNYVGINDKKY